MSMNFRDRRLLVIGVCVPLSLWGCHVQATAPLGSTNDAANVESLLGDWELLEADGEAPADTVRFHVEPGESPGMMYLSRVGGASRPWRVSLVSAGGREYASLELQEDVWLVSRLEVASQEIRVFAPADRLVRQHVEQQELAGSLMVEDNAEWQVWLDGGSVNLAFIESQSGLFEYEVAKLRRP